MRENNLECTLHIYLKLLTEELGLKLTIGGSKAYATKEGINLPALSPDSAKAKKLAYGYSMHESGHIADTDFHIWPKEPVLAKITNWFEDIRIETLRMKRYPGARKRLFDLVTLLVEDDFFTEPRESDSPAKLVSALVLYRLRSEVLGQSALNDYAKKADALIREQLPAGAVSRLNAMMFEVENCNSTQDCIDLAQSIMDMLQDEQEKAEEQAKQQQKQNDQQQQSQSQDPQQQAGQGGGAGEDDGSQQGQGPSQGGQPQQGQADPNQAQSNGQDQGQQSQTSQGTDPQGQADAGKNDAMANSLKSILDGTDDGGFGDLGRALEQMLEQMHNSAPNEAIDFPPAKKSDVQLGSSPAILGRIEESSRALKRRTLNLFEGQDRDKLLTKQSGNRLDAKRLYRVNSGNFRVFQKRIEGVAMNTAIEILLDCSSSMKEEGRLAVAADAALALQVALESADGLSASVSAFPAMVNSDRNGVMVVSDYGESARKAAPRFAALRPNGYTPMAEALLWSGSRLVGRKEDRKILLVVTDGQPENGKEPQYVSRAKAVKMKGELEKAGIEVLALGIKIDVSGLFGKSRAISDVKDLPQAMFAMMQETLLRKAA